MKLDCVRCGETFEDTAETFEFSTLKEPMCDECIHQENFTYPHWPADWKKIGVTCRHYGDRHMCDECYSMYLTKL